MVIHKPPLWIRSLLILDANGRGTRFISISKPVVCTDAAGAVDLVGIRHGIHLAILAPHRAALLFIQACLMISSWSLGL